MYVQLLSVLPPQSAKLLPKPYAELMLQDESPIADFYLKEFGFKIKWVGKKKVKASFELTHKEQTFEDDFPLPSRTYLTHHHL